MRRLRLTPGGCLMMWGRGEEKSVAVSKGFFYRKKAVRWRGVEVDDPSSDGRERKQLQGVAVPGGRCVKKVISVTRGGREASRQKGSTKFGVTSLGFYRKRGLFLGRATVFWGGGFARGRRDIEDLREEKDLMPGGICGLRNNTSGGEKENFTVKKKKNF